MGKRFSPEFRANAVNEVIANSRPIVDVARELGLVPQTLGNWVTEYRREHAGETPPDPVTESERDELARLRRENRELRMQNEFLGKATAFFAKEYR